MSTKILNSPNAAKAAVKESVYRHMTHTLGIDPADMTPRDGFRALELAIRDLLVERMLATNQRYDRAGAKRVYYLSLEFLIGRSLDNNLINLGLRDICQEILAELKINLQDVEDREPDAALGNGGLGRLAACFLDSLATLGMPGYGYGINYEYGLFRQEIRDGRQVEMPDNWRTYHTPWEIERPQDAVMVPLYGRIEHGKDRAGNYNPMWLDWKVVIGIPHDMPIAGFGGRTVNFLRLFSARASHEFDMSIFNEGDYVNAVQQKVQTETISKVLYPSEIAASGRELRLVQEYFLVACAVRDIVRRYRRDHTDFDAFPDQVAIQLNDTHPTLTVAELMRVFVDESDLSWEKAWEITTSVCAYTNHTLMSEALERWPVYLLEYVVPRHLQIILEINRRFLDDVALRWPGDGERAGRMSIIEEGPTKQVRMAHLAIVGSHSVNGVAVVHSELIKSELVPDFNALWPERFNCKTNGVTPRRWLLAANPPLAELITATIGTDWITNLDRLRALEPSAREPGFSEHFRTVKRSNKLRLAQYVKKTLGDVVDCDSLFDVHVKRIHEYKRQLLKVLQIAHDYLNIVEDGKLPAQPRTYFFAGKAAPGYHTAKDIIRVIHEVAQVIKRDRRASGHIKVVFVPDYRVSLAEIIIPAADLSEQISTAGTEASGTSNMKFATNGAMTIGTLDGANIEIREEVGAENIFIFGLTVEEIRSQRAKGPYRPHEVYERNPAVHRVLDAFRNNRFCQDSPGRHQWIYDRLLEMNERYYHLIDLESYLGVHDEATRLYQDAEAWSAKAILNVARIGKFSSDRTIREYAGNIWKIHPVTAEE
ncbi:MAG: glycogen/starch/alpha-glucan phosphorylase [Planctomycetes bacterium]|nr:glycogen/starch/alpha-glucan phosphorylase [Planctomycetota bacterium]